MNIGVAGTHAAGFFLLSHFCHGRAHGRPVLIDMFSRRPLPAKGFTIIENTRQRRISPGSFTVAHRAKNLDCLFLLDSGAPLKPLLNQGRPMLARGGFFVNLSQVAGPSREIQKWAKPHPVVFAFLNGSADAIKDGRIAWEAMARRPTLGIHRGASLSPAIGRLVQFLNSVSLGFGWEQGPLDDLLWSRAAWAASFGPTSVLLRKTYGEILESEPAKEMAARALEETASIMRAVR